MSTTVLQILALTPAWVFVVFVVLLALGVQQCFARAVPVAPVLAVPVGMACWSAGSALVAVAGHTTLQALVPIAWIAGAASTTALVLARRVPPGTEWDAATRRFRLPGSVVPLLLMQGIFMTRFAANVALALHPTLTGDAGFSLVTGLAYALFRAPLRAARCARCAWWGGSAFALLRPDATTSPLHSKKKEPPWSTGPSMRSRGAASAPSSAGTSMPWFTCW